MTMIHIGITEKSATIVSDSICYSPNVAAVSYHHKVVTLPHLDAAVATQGDAVFADAVHRTLTAREVRDCQSFDELDEILALALPYLLDELRQAGTDRGLPTEQLRDAQVFLVGYSPAAGRFVGRRYHGHADFRRDELGEMFTYPTIWRYRPDEFEFAHVAPQFSNGPKGRAFMAQWQAAPPTPRVTTREDWWALARNTWLNRAGQYVCRVPIGGTVYYTHLRRGTVTTVKMGELGVTREDQERMFAGTLNAVGQWLPCPGIDDNGEQHTKPYVECCGKTLLDKPCDCGSGTVFRDCHLVEPPAAEVA